ncbi:MAG TPA: FlgO family outer membrane protein [Thermoanaerobaculia bacterium]|nr:FlgO family outer membrane protein [Thermoanaerobaculia bacterium]
MNNRVLTVALSMLSLVGLAREVEAQKPLSDATEELAQKIATSMNEDQKRRVAVLPPRMNDGPENQLCTYIAEELLSHLVNLRKVEVVERGLLEKLLEEIDLGRSAAIDPKTAQEAKKISGADALVLGVVTEFPSYVAVNSRMIDTETGLIFAAAQVKILKDENVKQLMAPSTRVQSVTRSLSTSGSASSSELAPEPVVQNLDKFKFELTGCWAKGSDLECRFFVTNEAADRDLGIYGWSRVFDEEGNEYPVSAVALGNAGGDRSASNRLLTGVRVKLTMNFEGIPVATLRLAALEVSSSSARLTFRDVPIQRK